ncbi:medium-chain acyl-CoA ligase ACSF2, mitochondrial-like [Ptychodera flava]|uniref:medium-chain acyl-CoA ligase ACSF2, mitochondrial-like n=1 Tax=Ptychodera flava TaxID=63121 RepID=UPI00396A2EA6
MSLSGKSYLHAASGIPFTGKTLCDALDQSAAEFPDREAFVFASKSTKQRITFKKLREDAIRLAAGLVHLGLKPGERVGIWAENCYEWITSFYAMAYAKLVCVRVVVGFNEVYFEHLVNKTKMAALIIGPGDQERVLSNVAPELSNKTNEHYTGKEATLRTVIRLGIGRKLGMICYEEVMKMGDDEDFGRVGQLRETVDPDDEMMMLTTSGSTGLQKVVVRSHRISLENVHVYSRHWTQIVGADICYMAMNMFAHGSGELSLIAGVSHGFTVIVPDSNSDAESLVNFIREERVTVAFLQYTFVLDFLRYADVDKLNKSRLKYVFTSGNLAPAETLERVRKELNLNIFTVLGITELGHVTFNNNPEKFWKIGYPIDHFEVKIINDSGKIVPRGRVGELCARSPYTMVRYWDDEEQTKSAIDESGWYRTGDMCKMEEDGCLDIIGRKSDIIIKDAGNIYPVEVDQVLVRHPKVKLSRTIGVPDQRFIEEVCACVCLEEGEEVTVEELLQFARRFLPEFHVPKYILFVDSIPCGPTGKVRIQELQAKAMTMFGI